MMENVWIRKDIRNVILEGTVHDVTLTTLTALCDVAPYSLVHTSYLFFITPIVYRK